MMLQILRKRPWYIAGLAFECSGCGQCCAGPDEGYVWVTNEQIASITKYLEISEAQMRRKYVRKIGRRFSLVERSDNNDCIFLTLKADGGKQCRIYPARPAQCMTWPFWPSNLTSPQSWALVSLRCGGINRGTIHSCDEIEAKRKATS